MELEVHARQQAAAERADEVKAGVDKKWEPLGDLIDHFSWESSFKLLTGQASPETVQSCRDYLAMMGAEPPKTPPAATHAGRTGPQA